VYKFLRAFTAQQPTNRSGAAKLGNFSLNIALFRIYREMCGLLYYRYIHYYESS